MPKPVVIVESPAKAKTIASYLGEDFEVESSVGHIRDLPASASEVPAAYKKEPWARLGVNPNEDFKPLYVITKDRKEVVKRLKEVLKNASELYLATDEDREGESIAWHLVEVLSPKVPVKRMVFHEITKEAIEYAKDHWRDLDRRLVDAQEARRILDRLFGYEVSPVLWKKVMPKASAGRVQSVAVRMIVERERARIAFKSANWWDILVKLELKDTQFNAHLVAVNDRKIATGKDFTDKSQLKNPDLLLLNQALASELAEKLRSATFRVSEKEEKPFKRSPLAPFMTSTLQQEAARKLRFSASKTMRIAQRLYESGWITYMRTDSIALSEAAIKKAREIATEKYGKDFVPQRPRKYVSKVKNAQEAHEAIRPASEQWKSIEQARKELSDDEALLYELIYNRTIASQMADAEGKNVAYHIIADCGNSGSEAEFNFRNCEFVSSGTVILKPGYLAVYQEEADEQDDDDAEELTQIPDLKVGQICILNDVLSRSHFTRPPARYTEATLVKALEEFGIGRPSTYANIIDTILSRGYVYKKGTALVPSYLAFAVVALLEKYFPELIDYNFTAAMEDDLDEIANGHKEMVPWLKKFYFGDQTKFGLKQEIEKKLKDIDAKEINSILIGKDKDGTEINVRVGRYGPYLEYKDQRCPLPEGILPDELTIEKALELLSSQGLTEKELGVDPETGLKVFLKKGRFGPYVQLEQSPSSTDKPKMAALLKTMNPETVTLSDALKLLKLPRLVGLDPKDNQPITVHNGRFGPYLQKGSERRSLPDESLIFNITLQEALKYFEIPKTQTKFGSATVKELGVDEKTGHPIVIRVGRYGPYLTDGETNAPLKNMIDFSELDLNQALSILNERRSLRATTKKDKVGRAKK